MARKSKKVKLELEWTIRPWMMTLMEILTIALVVGSSFCLGRQVERFVQNTTIEVSK